ncbi:MAG: 50S ribosomal protein L10 [Bacteroidota bacterium]|nr:50S ribosomal protein L10 [Bacteroidota bacterium]
MKREGKDSIINNLVEEINNTSHLYIADASGLDAAATTDLRGKCYKKQVKLMVVKNTLLKRALDKSNLEVEELYDVLKGPTALMFSEVGNAPAKIIKDFTNKDRKKPLIKGAYVEESIYVGENLLDTLASIKSKEELIGDIVTLLQSPMKNVVSSLKSGNNILTGVLETLSEKSE